MAQANSSQTAIINAALAQIGSTARVTSINDGSNAANRAKAFWDEIVRFATAQHPWNHALGRRLLNENGDVPAFGWERQFELPEDCVRWLPPARGDDDFYEGEREGNLILTNASAPLPCRYIRAEFDVTKWSPGFVWLVKELLAELMAEGATQSESITNRMTERAEKLLLRAKRMDGLETGRRRRGAVVARSDWLTARGPGRGYRGR